MSLDEEYVRANWKALGNLWWDREYDENWISASAEDGKPIRLFRGRSTDAQAWSAAAEFTRERREQIRQLEAEIELVRGDSDNLRSILADSKYGSDWTTEYCRWMRILARLEVALADLRKGMS